MAKIYLIRHAESIANSKGIYQGQTYDTGLSDVGKKQAQALAKKLTNIKINSIICSPLKRTQETAKEVSKLINLPIGINKKIIETNHGLWEGKNKEWVLENYAKTYKNWLSKPTSVKFPQGESFEETVSRVSDFMSNFLWSRNTLVVTHDNIIRVIVCQVTNIEIDKMWDIDLDSAGITTLKVIGENGKREYGLIRLNEKDHLKGIKTNLYSHAL